MTKHLRGTINAWHFWFGWHLRLRLVSLSSAVCVACPLMRRYNPKEFCIVFL
ncbi:DUF3265 domain-containing protein [Vibrio cincinnatiensis]|nr:DUF3265 domain-containing protein [Vibrio cincinnatiensis]MCG3748512.1 DUF3265 domain-containing protein [Vibrio cincinnatiensis]